MQNVLSLILGGGRGARLYPLTMLRSKPAVPLAGKYRLIDIPISNCINSGCNRIYVLTQFLSVSLHRHIGNTYKFDPFSRGFVEVLAAQQTPEKSDWYQGTADAVRQNARYIHEDPCDHVMILSGDQIYRMDFRHLLDLHKQTDSDCTIAVLPVHKSQTAGFGLCKLDDDGKVVDFIEKPKQEEQLGPFVTSEDWMRKRGIEAAGRPYLASMGIYLFKRDALFHLLNSPPLATDFGKEVFPRSIKTHRVTAYLFDGFWEDVGTIKSYHEASLALTGDAPPFDFHTLEGVIYTRMRYLPASRINAARLDQCLVADGCVIGAGTTITRCVIGVRTQIGRNVTLRNSVISGADRFQTRAERAEKRHGGVPCLGIGDGTVIDNAIIDKDASIGANCRIINQDRLTEADGKNYVIREGIVVIPKGAVLLDGTVI
ncbi:MAG: glucose-1-phosphate adenylyltransferase [Gemmataceae bacterium]